MKIYNLIIAAMDEEMNALVNIISNLEKVNIANEELYSFTLKGKDYLLGRGKIGKVHTAIYLTKLFENVKVSRVFNIGTSGGVDSTLNLSDVIIADRVCYHDVDVTGFDYQLGQMCGCPVYFECDKDFVNSKIIDSKYQIKRGLIVSGDQFVTKNNINSLNVLKFKDVLACDMEAAAVGQVCNIYNIPFVVVRSISDIVTKENNSEVFDSNLTQSSTNSAQVLLELIK